VIEVHGADSIPAPRTNVVLHRIGRDVQGPIDSMLTDSRGSFHFRFKADTSAIFLLSARFAGIEYFSPPVHTDPALPDTAMVVIVSDTSSSAPVATGSRHVVVSRPGQSGGRAVLEIVVLENRGDRTRVAVDSLTPSWSAPTPKGAVGFQPGNGDFSPEAMRFAHDSVTLDAPIAPGEKRVIFSYLLPTTENRITFPISDSIEVLNLLVEEETADLKGVLTPADTERIEGRVFRRWTGSVVPGSKVELVFALSKAQWLLPVLVASVGTAFLVGFLILRQRAAPIPARASGSDPLVDALARLDARYVGRETEVPAEEWATYVAERARLKRELEAHLAAGGGSS
jgi:hypothetical protein